MVPRIGLQLQEAAMTTIPNVMLDAALGYALGISAWGHTHISCRGAGCRMSEDRKGFLMLPHATIDVLLRLHLTACELKICLLILSWTLGFGRHECPAGLTALANRITSHSRRQIGKAIAQLVRRGILEIAQAPEFRSPTRYRIGETRTHGAVSPTTQCRPRHTPELPGDFIKSVMEDTESVAHDIEYVADDILDSVAHDTQERKELYKEREEKEKEKKTPPSPQRGNSLSKKVETEQADQKQGRRSSTLSGDFVPLPGGTPLQNQHECIEALLKTWVAAGQSDVHESSFLPRDKKLLDRILEGSPQARATVVSEFEAAMDVVANNPGMLEDLDGTSEGLCQVLRYRKKIANQDIEWQWPFSKGQETK